MKKRENSLKNKQIRLTVILASVFAVLLIVYLAVIRPIVNKVEEEEVTPLETLPGEVEGLNGRYLMFPQVERKGMQSIKVENDYGGYEFYRDANGDFVIRGHEGTAYDLTIFSSLVTSCGYTLAKVKVVDNATDAELEEYGLKKPAGKWTLTTTAGDKYTVDVGYDLLTGGGYYVMLEGRRSVYVLDTTLKDTILSPIEALLSPVLVAGLSKEDYFLIDPFVVFKGEDMLCSITTVPEEEKNNPESLVENIMNYPTNYFPNDDVYLDILYGYQNLMGTSVVKLGATDDDFKKYGLDKPAHTIYFVYNGVEIMLMFSELQESSFYYCVSSLFPDEIMTIGADTAYYLEYDLIDWVEVYPFQQWITSVSEVSVKGSGADVSFKLKHGKNENDNATLEVTCSNGKVIPDDDVYNFRQFYKTLLSIAIQGYAPGEKTEKMTDAEKAALTKESNNILTFTLTSLKGTKTVYKFYPYSGTGRRALMTVNGSGEFFVQTDLIEKIASDANKVLSGLDINSYGKE